MSNRKRFDVEIPDGQHLGFSRDSDGAYRAHLFDDETNQLVGHAELFEPGDDDWGASNVDNAYGWESESEDRNEDLDELAEALGNLVALGIITAAALAAPHIKRWWTDKVLPALKSTPARIKSAWKHVARSRSTDEEVITAELVVAEPPSVQSSSEVDVALEELRVTMTSDEARQRFVAALVAKAFADEQLRLLRAARIEAGEDNAELERALRELTPEQVRDAINRMLANDPALLDRESLAEFGRLVDRGSPDPAYLPLGRAGVREVLRLTDGQSTIGRGDET